MNFEEIKKIINGGTEEEKATVRTYFVKYGNTPEKEVEIHEILINLMLELSKEEIIVLSSIIGYPVFLRICLIPKIRHKFPLLQDGASLIIIDSDKNVLVQQRTDNEKYGFSGGCQELGEELKEVASRECLEETGLKVDLDDMIEVCEVSGLSRKNAYPNGDIVVNNTALHIAYAENARGNLNNDSESKSIQFKPITFLLDLPKEQLHDEDFVKILNSLLHDEPLEFSQPKLSEIPLPERKKEDTFADYLYSLSTEQSLYLAKRMGYGNFLYNALDERIRDIFPHLIDKSVLIAIDGQNILLEKKESRYLLPKVVQSVGESFENIIDEAYGLETSGFKLVTKVSGTNTYDKDTNTFINAMIFAPIRRVEQSEVLTYFPLTKAEELLDKEDLAYLNAYILKKETYMQKKEI